MTKSTFKFSGAWILLAGLISGCSTSAMRPGNVNAVAPIATASTATRAGNVYLLRGFIGVFSTGIDSLGGKLNKQGISASVFQDDQWSSLATKIRERYSAAPNREPLILIGHSYGADDALRMARELNRDHITVDLLITLDPVTPPEVTSNVLKCINLYESNGVWDTLPWLRGVPVKKPDGSSTQLVNADIRTDRKDLLEPGLDHFNIEKKEKIHKEVISLVMATCPQRGSSTVFAPKPAPSASPTTLAPIGTTGTTTVIINGVIPAAAPVITPTTAPSKVASLSIMLPTPVPMASSPRN